MTASLSDLVDNMSGSFISKKCKNAWKKVLTQNTVCDG